MKVLSVALMSFAASAVSAVAVISRNVCKTISNRDKTHSLDHMSDLLKNCPPDKRECVAETVAKVADSLFPQPGPPLPPRSPRHHDNEN